MKEHWRWIAGFERKYEVSNVGRIRSYAGDGTPRFRKGVPDKRGYVGFSFYIKGGKRKLIRIHQLVARAFIPNPRNLGEVNHIDGDKSNNRVANLEWVTRSENNKHAYINGLKEHVSLRGEASSRSKLKDSEVLKIRELYKLGKSTVVLSKKYGVHFSSIARIVRGETWTHI